MGKWYVGTSGFSYDDWVGPFYPGGMKKGDFLGYYAGKFSFVELNFSYYRQPEAEMLERMRGQVPGDFLFSIKGHRSLTHERGREWERECDVFRRGIVPLVAHGQCGAVLLQFPWSFHYDRENRIFLGGLTERLRELPLVVEFRNREWERESVRQELRERSVGLVATDLPEMGGLPVFSGVVTGQIGYARFHGRNRENWWDGDNVSRYDYRYSESELRERAVELLKMAAESGRLFIAFNNHYKGQAADNAFQLTRIMEAMEKA
jgi:uncharacterized protein YecE (DUF72 family)